MLFIIAKLFHVFHSVSHLRLFIDGERVLDYMHCKMKLHEFLLKKLLQPKRFRQSISKSVYKIINQSTKTCKSEVLFWCGSSICWQVGTHILQSTCIRELLTLETGLQQPKDKHPKKILGMKQFVSRLIGKKRVAGDTEHFL